MNILILARFLGFLANVYFCLTDNLTAIYFYKSNFVGNQCEKNFFNNNLFLFVYYFFNKTYLFYSYETS